MRGNLAGGVGATGGGPSASIAASQIAVAAITALCFATAL